MPCQNKSQMRACFAQQKKGKNGWNCRKWAKETRDINSLPEKGKKKPKWSRKTKT